MSRDNVQATDLAGFERFAFRCCHLLDATDIFHLVSARLTEDANAAASDDECTISFVANGELLILPRGQIWSFIFVPFQLVLFLFFRLFFICCHKE